MGKTNDIESGGSESMYSLMYSTAQSRWHFIRKVYAIIAIQLLATAVVAAFVVTHQPIAHFFGDTWGGLACYIVLAFVTLIVMCPLYAYRNRHPLNYLFLGIFTILMAISVGLSCSYTNGKIILEAVILTAAVVISLTLYTFWAVSRGHDFSFLGPFLFGSLNVLLVFGIIQIFFPFGPTGDMIYGCVGALIFCGYIIYDTDNLIERFNYDEYIWAAVALYLDIINLFLQLLSVLRR